MYSSNLSKSNQGDSNMPLFPQFGPEYYDEKDRPIVSKMQAFYSQAISINESFWAEADTDLRFFSGDQTLWQDLYGNLPMNRRRQFQFNRIRRIVNMIGGYQRRNRKSTIVVPVENANDHTADQFTKMMMYLANQEGILETISTSFEGALVTGMNLLQVWMDYKTDPVSGNIRVDNCNYNSFLIDPFFRKPDLSDCNGIWKRNYVTKREAVALLPGHEEDIMKLVGMDSRDGKFQFMPENYNYSVYNLLSYDEFYYKDYRESRMLVDTQTGETVEWKSDDEERLRNFLQLYPQITVIKNEVPTIKLAILVQGKVMYDGPQPNGLDCYPFVPVFAYYHPELPYFPYRIQGVVRGLRDAQYLYTHRRIIELDILESQINSGWKFKENALVNPEDAFLTGQGRSLALKEEASMTDVERIEPPQVPPSMIQLSELLAQEIQQIAGVNEELLGSASDDKAGVLAMLRQGAGLTTLQILFDQLDFAQKQLGKIILNLIQSNYTPGKVKRILNEDPSQEFYDRTFGRYDAMVEEGLNTATQKQMQFAQLLQLRELGVPIPDDILVESATLQNKKELMEILKNQSQQAAQAQQQQQEVEMAKLKADIDLVESTAEANRGVAVERASKVAENQEMAEERKASAMKDRELGLLHLVKALKEIETVDLQQLEKIVSLAQLVKKEEQANMRPQMAQNMQFAGMQAQ